MELTLNDTQYRISKLNVFEQLKVARKLLPLFAEMATDYEAIQDSLESAAQAMLPKMADVISQMSEEDCNAIIHPCLGVVSREHMKGWVPVFAHGALAFDDIELMTMLRLVAQVVADSLGNFLQELPAVVMQQPPTD
ncbi:hypothetical protein GWD52_07135 [Enterobacteriaceae bacterium 4M9]|nr:hypothetical protein [Enterobacteriaceae bacterium 4M9]